MLAGLLIVALSSALFVYWFRYSCILILRSRFEVAAASSVVPDTRFHYHDVLERLNGNSALDGLQASLERDFCILKYLVEHAAGLELASLEDRLLMFDYRVMQAVYWLTRTAAPQQARNALTEMASVLAVIAHRIGEQAGFQIEA